MKRSREKILKLRKALQYFVDRVEEGTIMSSKTYSYYKRVLDETADKLCASCGNPEHPHRYRHPFVEVTP